MKILNTILIWNVTEYFYHLLKITWVKVIISPSLHDSYLIPVSSSQWTAASCISEISGYKSEKNFDSLFVWRDRLKPQLLYPSFWSVTQGVRCLGLNSAPPLTSCATLDKFFSVSPCLFFVFCKMTIIIIIIIIIIPTS